MRAKTLQILWHDRRPVFSIDFEPTPGGRLATCGGDSCVRIWRVVRTNMQPPEMEFLATLSRHAAEVNCVRWCPTGGLIASGGDDGTVLIWQQCEQRQESMLEDEDESIQTWRMISLLRGASSDLYDLSWSPDGRFIISACVDNTYKCIHVLTDHQHFVQGVAWDPLQQFIATQSSDRSMIIYALNTSKNGGLRTTLLSRHSKTDLAKLKPKSSTLEHQGVEKTSDTGISSDIVDGATTLSGEEAVPAIDPLGVKSKNFRMFHDENLNSFFRRLAFSPDGSLLIVPAGLSREYTPTQCGGQTPSSSAESNLYPMNKTIGGTGATSDLHTVYVYGRSGLSSDPILHLPGHKTAAVAVRFNPNRYEMLQSTIDGGISPTILLPYRYIFAVATQDSVVVYDTQHTRPIAFFGNLHYATFTDVAWSPDGHTLIMSSADGFCSMVELDDEELGVIYKPVAHVSDVAESMPDTLASLNPSTNVAELSTIARLPAPPALVTVWVPKPTLPDPKDLETTSDDAPSLSVSPHIPKKRRIVPSFLGVTPSMKSL
ncbi:hypothetical protein BASA50_009729 [Batrachochytrium salamandrivorans]|uniref:CAF1B/HIR1 beta-propeller domain-containing protein n=1 Tax=Batrachochytrium salamandrivorans TaxID=1357716 RepID=A0ABQ8F0Q2_9FUNG|nr:hypothetical protein BASA50_009729 [Batrachochytrium salamandrivorans]KAH6592307.1 hypothetical protein BASA61_004630 [Batrachochytrium salamandrivorans]